jgi:hypothetical protein
LAGENFALQAAAGILVADGRVVPALGVKLGSGGVIFGVLREPGQWLVGQAGDPFPPGVWAVT